MLASPSVSAASSHVVASGRYVVGLERVADEAAVADADRKIEVARLDFLPAERRTEDAEADDDITLADGRDLVEDVRGA